jgi:hypothetical protein
MNEILTMIVLASAVALGGCAAPDDGKNIANAPKEQTYTPLGSLIAKKGPTRGETGNVDLQSFDNNRTMNNSVNNSGKN